MHGWGNTDGRTRGGENTPEAAPHGKCRIARAAWRRTGPAPPVATEKAPSLCERLGAWRRRPAARCSPTLLGVVPSPRGPLTSVFGKGTGVTAPPRPPARKSTTEDERCERKASQRGFRGGAPEGASRMKNLVSSPPALPLSRIGGGRSGQAARPIRTGLLRPSRALRTRPVHPVVFRGPSACSRTGRTDLRGGLALRCLQRLSRCGVATRRCP